MTLSHSMEGAFVSGPTWQLDAGQTEHVDDASSSTYETAQQLAEWTETR